MANYRFKNGLSSIFHVDAETAGTELNRIYKRDGEITARQVVEDSRPYDAPLHPCFEWRDKIAAERYRESQARNLIAAVVEVKEQEKKEMPGQIIIETRAFEHVRGGYHPLEVIVSDDDMHDELLDNAKRAMREFKRKYERLLEMKPVIRAIDWYLEGGETYDEAEQAPHRRGAENCDRAGAGVAV